MALHTRLRSGPDPAELPPPRSREGREGLPGDRLAPVEALARTAEILGGERPAEDRQLAAAIQRRRQAGSVPVLLLGDGPRVVRGFAELLAELEAIGLVPTSWGSHDRRRRGDFDRGRDGVDAVGGLFPKSMLNIGHAK